ncbi:gibberellin 2-beta-dioxygenase 7-like [Cryptomeria japonica]|uniref:gibberellin 2-beta-dioxygenase 7-like n=1 Tax=Cryptomeria japonica TaxID=3369 RepID=UPI0027DA61DF|nr:gibberellin 2-beta-dioxygenase 7-like [Cryptomeria japonica]
MLFSLQSHVDLPLIDISQFPSDFDREALNCLQNNPALAAVREACKEWGVFYVGNHGIPIDLLQQMEFQSRQIYSVSAEAKERAVTCDPVMSYHRRGNTESFTMLNLPESDSINELSNKIWPQEERSAMFREGISRIIIEGDSQIIIDGISRSSFHNWKLNKWVPMVKEHLKNFESYEIGHVYREGNQVVDYLVNLVVGEYDDPVYFCQTSVAEDIKGQCLKDCQRYPR